MCGGHDDGRRRGRGRGGVTDSCAKLRGRGGWWEDQYLGRCWSPIGPRNTYSNAAYAVCGGLAVVLRPHLAATPLFAMAMVALCRSEEHTSELQSLMRISYA